LETTDTYKTITTRGQEVLYKSKNSKFYGYAFPISNESEAKQHIDHLKKKHQQARHWCYAWQLGTEHFTYRSNDDGEPSNSAGQPIHGQIQSFELTNILVVVVRYFGGIKLGVGGLISSYRKTAQLALEASDILTKTIDIYFTITFEYKDLNKIMRIIKKHKINIIKQDMQLQCMIEVSVRKNNIDQIKTAFSPLYEVQISRKKD